MIDREPFIGWIIKEKLGKGSLSKVYRAEKNFINNAVKQIIIPCKESEKDENNYLHSEGTKILEHYKPVVEEIKKEIGIIQKLSETQGIVTYYDYMVRKYDLSYSWEILIRMEYLNPLDKYIKKNGIKLKEVLCLAIDVSHALQVCNNENILHRDIKESNILVSKYGNFKLGDFGISKSISNICKAKKNVNNHMAPEIYNGEIPDFLTDMYSLGITICKLLSDGKIDFEDNKIKLPEYINDSIAKTVLKTVSVNKNERYSSFNEMKLAYNKLLSSTRKDELEEYVLVPEFINNGFNKNNQEIDSFTLDYDTYDDKIILDEEDTFVREEPNVNVRREYGRYNIINDEENDVKNGFNLDNGKRKNNL